MVKTILAFLALIVILTGCKAHHHTKVVVPVVKSKHFNSKVIVKHHHKYKPFKRSWQHY